MEGLEAHDSFGQKEVSKAKLVVSTSVTVNGEECGLPDEIGI